MRKEEKTDTIPVEDDEGRPLVVIEISSFTAFTATDGGQQWVRGSRRFECDGQHCNVEGDGFRTVPGGAFLRRIR